MKKGNESAHRYGFLAINRGLENLGVLGKLLSLLPGSAQSAPQSSFALVSLAGKNLETYRVEELLVLPCSPEAIAEAVIKISERGQFDLYIDEENEPLIDDAFHSRINQVCRKQPERRGKFPILRSRKRDPDQFIRQTAALHAPLERGEISFNSRLSNDPAIMAEVQQIGRSVAADALAGAVWIASEQRSIILENRSNKYNPYKAMGLEDEDGCPMWKGMRRQGWSPPKK